MSIILQAYEDQMPNLNEFIEKEGFCGKQIKNLTLGELRLAYYLMTKEMESYRQSADEAINQLWA